jgi:hypothetical protein
MSYPKIDDFNFDSKVAENLEKQKQEAKSFPTCSSDDNQWLNFTFPRADLFSVKYPNCFQYVDANDHLTHSFSFIPASVDLSKYPKGQSPYRLPNISIGSTVNPGLIIDNFPIEEKTTIDGYSAKKTTYQDSHSGLKEIIIITEQVFLFYVPTQTSPDQMPIGVSIMFSEDDKSNNYSELIDKIVSTIKINKSAVIDVKNVKK